jgi:carbon-monoxide dehydrogenase medium subunit
VEAALAKGFSSASLNGVKVSADHVAGDLHASAEYRAQLIKVQTRKAVQDALS